MTHLSKMMLEELERRNYAQTTIRLYIQTVEDFARYFKRAHDQLAARIADQRKTGLRTEITDRGHKLEAIVYTPEGSAMQLHDTAQVDIQILDGGKVIHSEHATLHYVVLMTVAEDRWKVRLLQEVP